MAVEEGWQRRHPHVQLDPPATAAGLADIHQPQGGQSR
jgi:hypothetical protein